MRYSRIPDSDTERPETIIDCPVPGCGKVVNCYNGPSQGIEDVEGLLRACVKAAVDALALHIREDHIGHDETCFRRVSPEFFCDCHVGGLSA